MSIAQAADAITITLPTPSADRRCYRYNYAASRNSTGYVGDQMSNLNPGASNWGWRILATGDKPGRRNEGWLCDLQSGIEVTGAKKSLKQMVPTHR